MLQRVERVLKGCAVAASTVGAAAAATLALWEQVFSRNPFGLFYAAVMVTAWVGGLLPGLFATALAMALIDYLMIPSFFSGAGWRDLVQACTFAGIAVLVSSLKSRRQRAMDALRDAKRKADAANDAKDQFLAVLSHELRTPLTPALAIAAALERDPDLPADLRGDVNVLRRNIELEARLIDDLLDITRITRGKLSLFFQTIDLVEVVIHAIEICRLEAAAKGVDIRVEASDCTRRCVRGDAARLQQIVWNLVKNAVKFTDAAGCVTVRCVDAGVDHVRVEVIDTGAGIAPDVLPHIFDAFEQGGNDVTRTFGGLGLGLAISAALADAHGGMLTAASDGLGQGARFTLELTALESLPLAPPPTEPKPAHARRLRLLLVEDHPDTSRVMTRLLRSLDHDVHAVGDVRAALRTAEVQQFDLVISDIGLPDGSGLELMRQLRERYQLKGIALSGYGMEDDMRRSREAGFDAHVTKPVDFDSLAAAIADVAA
jgi:signal transduction histidine kinase